VMTFPLAELSKPDPFIVTSSPVPAAVVEIPEMLGFEELRTVNSSGLVAGPSVDVETVT